MREPRVRHALETADPADLESICDRLFSAYQESSPLADGRRERMPPLNPRELLSVVAHFGAVGDHVAQIREIVRAFS